MKTLTALLLESFGNRLGRVFAMLPMLGVLLLTSAAYAVGPALEYQPTPVEVVDTGGRALLVVGVFNNDGPFTFQWQRKVGAAPAFSNIPGATDQWYDFKPVGAGDVGQYRVSVTNAGGTTVSNVTVLTLANLKDAVEAPTLTLRSRGDVAAFSQTATTHDGVDALQTTFPSWGQWSTLEAELQEPGRVDFWIRLDDVETWYGVGGDVQEFLGDTGGTWVKRSFVNPYYGPIQVGWIFYMNDVGATAYLDEVTFTPASELPPILQYPQDAFYRADAGSNVFIWSQPVGDTDAMSFQWQRKVGGASVFSDIPGATDQGFELENVQAGDVGEYRVAITNGNGTTFTNATALSLTNLKTVADTTLGWRTRGTAESALWFGQSTTTRDGVDALQAGPMNGPGYATLELVVPGAGDLSFWVKVSGNHLEIYKDWNGEPGVWDTGGQWVQRTVHFTEDGQQTLQVQIYTENPGVTAWVDQVVFTPASELPPILNGRPDFFTRADAGGNVPFWSEAAEGSGLVTYQWQRKVGGASVFSDIPGATENEFELQNVQAGDVGEYRVKVTNLHGTTTSEPGALSLANLKTSVDTPSLHWVTRGSPEEVLWFAQSAESHDGVDALQTGPNTNGGYSFLQTQVPGAGELRFWVKVSGGSLEIINDWEDEDEQGDTGGAWVEWTLQLSDDEPATVALNLRSFGPGATAWVDQVVFTPASQLPPILTDQPEKIWADLGARVRFATEVTDSGLPTTYQWQRDTGGGSFVDLPGQTTDELIFPVQAGDVGLYRVVVTNSHGSTISEPAELHIAIFKTALDTVFPWWVSTHIGPWAPQSVNTHDGVSALMALDDDGDLRTNLPSAGVLTFWVRSLAGEIAFEANGDEDSEETNGAWVQRSLLVYDDDLAVRFSFNGNDTVGSAWLDQVQFTPASQLPPLLTDQPEIIWADLGARANFATEVADSGLPTTYQWQRDIGGGNFVDLAGQTGDTLVFPNVQAGDAGVYRVVVTNSNGSTISDSRPLQIAIFKTALDTAFPWWVSTHIGPWAPQSVNTHDGVSALMALDDDGDLRTNLPSAGVLTFWVRSLAGEIEFEANGNEYTEETNGAWVQRSLLVYGDDLAVRFSFDGDDTRGSAWLDQVQFTPASQLPPIFEWQPDKKLGIELGSYGWEEVGSVADGGPFTYQWQKWNSGLGSFQNVPGATALRLEINNFQLADAGDYRVIVTNAHGSTTSEATTWSAINYRAALDTPAIEWWSYGDRLWTVQSAVTYDGVDAMSSGGANDEDYSRTYLECWVDGPAILKFRWKVSSDIDDVVRLAVNGTDVAEIGGNVDWTQREVEIPAGGAFVRFTYEKDDDDAEGADTAYVDDVVLTPIIAYSAWRAAHFTESELNNPAISGFAADPNHNGLANALEAILGRDPKAIDGDDSSVISVDLIGSGNNRRLALTFEMPAVAVTGIVLEVLESPNLQSNSWNPIATKEGAGAWNGAATVTETWVTPDHVRVEVQSLSTTQAGKTFLRLRVRPSGSES